eukprot:1156351-Pelagomonas_calceolata.AAC.18
MLPQIASRAIFWREGLGWEEPPEMLLLPPPPPSPIASPCGKYKTAVKWLCVQKLDREARCYLSLQHAEPEGTFVDAQGEGALTCWVWLKTHSSGASWLKTHWPGPAKHLHKASYLPVANVLAIHTVL